MDLKEPGNLVYLVGTDEGRIGRLAPEPGRRLVRRPVPTVDAAAAKRTFAAVHAAISAGLCPSVPRSERRRLGRRGRRDGLCRRTGHVVAVGGRAARLRAMPGFSRGAELDACCCSPNRTRDSCVKCRRKPAERFEQALDGVPHAVVGRDRIRTPAGRLPSRRRCRRHAGDRCGTCGLEGSVAEAAALVRMPMAKSPSDGAAGTGNELRPGDRRTPLSRRAAQPTFCT